MTNTEDTIVESKTEGEKILCTKKSLYAKRKCLIKIKNLEFAFEISFKK